MASRPERRVHCPHDVLLGRAHQPHEELERVTATTLGEQLPKLLGVLSPALRPIVGHVVGNVIHRELIASDPRCRGLQHESTARRDADKVRRSTGFGDERFDILDLAFHGVG